MEIRVRRRKVIRGQNSKGSHWLRSGKKGLQHTHPILHTFSFPLFSH
jgi:hypothetical protein